MVRFSEYISYNLWLIVFLEEQGYSIKYYTIFWDNKIVILVETNVRNSFSGNSWHINIHYFFIKYWVENVK